MNTLLILLRIAGVVSWSLVICWYALDAIRAFTRKRQAFDPLCCLIAMQAINVVWFLSAWLTPDHIQQMLRGAAYMFSIAIAAMFVRAKGWYVDRSR